jgi:hypothetical protein
MLDVSPHSEVGDSWRYVEVFSQGRPFRSMLMVPQVVDVSMPSTSAMVSLAKAWVGNPRLVDFRSVSTVPEAMAGKAIEFSTPGSGDGWAPGDLAILLRALAGVRSDSGARIAGPPAWVSHTTFDLGPAGLASQSSMMAGRLLQEVIAETRVRWRFISLYRIFEAAYLIALQERFVRDFLSRPGEVVADIQGALGSELATFTKLVEDRGLEDAFEAIRVVADSNTTNRFLHAVKRKRKGESLAGWRQGVAYVYRLRCAIVHAGQHDVVFERYQDGEEGLELLTPKLEDAVISLLSITKI